MFKTLSAKAATQLDQELMGSGRYSIDQLMELAGLSVAQAIYSQYPPTSNNEKVLVLVGPGNNGGDGLVAARHLKLWKYDPVIYYPKKTTKIELYANLMTQLNHLGVEEISTLDQVKQLLSTPHGEPQGVKIIIDSLFGFSFKPPIRPPFDDLIGWLSDNHNRIAPIVSVDIPSGWDVDNGPIDQDIGSTMLVSLTAPKPCATLLKPNVVHYLGGRFINDDIGDKYGIKEIIGLYKGNDMIVKL